MLVAVQWYKMKQNFTLSDEDSEFLDSTVDKIRFVSGISVKASLLFNVLVIFLMFMSKKRRSSVNVYLLTVMSMNIVSALKIIFHTSLVNKFKAEDVHMQNKIISQTTWLDLRQRDATTYTIFLTALNLQVCMSADRCMAVCKPLFYFAHRPARFAKWTITACIASCLIIGLIYSIISCYPSDPSYGPDEHECYYDRDVFFGFRKIYLVWSSLCTAVIVASNACIIYVVKLQVSWVTLSNFRTISCFIISGKTISQSLLGNQSRRSCSALWTRKENRDDNDFDHFIVSHKLGALAQPCCWSNGDGRFEIPRSSFWSHIWTKWSYLVGNVDVQGCSSLDNFVSGLRSADLPRKDDFSLSFVVNKCKRVVTHDSWAS